jgi:uncharacterized protein with PIN domain
MKSCIQCNSEIDLLSDDLTMYQVDKTRHLYCVKCKSPREEYVSPRQISDMRERICTLERRINNAWKAKLLMLIFGAVIGFVFLRFIAL